ncbi:undecaprenyl-phosphate glucose phosphotransferase [Halomonas garicola]|uniref:undecaprenyl-phosphate glucose phosphotransferase n=1 Tax=Halomonas garicola TaxID=1690008 RepID=UPI00289F1E57|nr:undecaprenyl-phosphate glucose phosphotransferase [Halomonas garicola]
MSSISTRTRQISGFQGYTHILTRSADLLIVVLAAMLAHIMRFGTLGMSERYVWAVTIGVVLASVILPSFRLYQSWRGRLRAELMVRLAVAYLVIGAGLTVVAFFSGRSLDFSRLWVFGWMLNGALLSILVRAIAYPVLNNLRARGKNRRRVLLVGDAHSCATAYTHLTRVPSAGFDVNRILLVGDDDQDELQGRDPQQYFPGIPIEHEEEEVWICLPVSEGKAVREIQNNLSLSTSNVRYMPDMHDFRLINHSVSNVADLYLLDLSCSPMTGWSRFLKAGEDRLIAAIILLLISPILAVVSIGVKLSSRGPVFYRQERVGWNGRSFEMLKFRSMPVDVEKHGVQWGGAQKKNTTRFGAFIRRTSLDELPQFINVLKGDMSIVGPRPERTVFVDQFKHEIPGYMQKHMVKAGITGWAQINGWRGDTDLAKRIECDLWYIDNWSLWLDLRIIFLTVFKGFNNKNAY